MVGRIQHQVRFGKYPHNLRFNMC